jgi:hypothetical protein
MTEQEVLDADERIHCLFYFITPHRIKDLDIVFLEELSMLAPIIPIVSKADTMIVQEKQEFALELNDIINQISSKKGFSCIYDFKIPVEMPEIIVADHGDESAFHENTRDDGLLDLTKRIINEDLQIEIKDLTLDEIIENKNNEIITSEIRENGIDFDSPFSDVNDNEYTMLNPNSSTDTIENQNNHSITFINTIIKAAETIHLLPKSVEPNHTYDLRKYPQPHTLTQTNLIPMDVSKVYPNLFMTIAHLDRYRVYPWGTLDIYDEKISCLRRLQRLLFETGNLCCCSPSASLP